MNVLIHEGQDMVDEADAESRIAHPAHDFFPHGNSYKDATFRCPDDPIVLMDASVDDDDCEQHYDFQTSKKLGEVCTNSLKTIVSDEKGSASQCSTITAVIEISGPKGFSGHGVRKNEDVSDGVEVLLIPDAEDAKPYEVSDKLDSSDDNANKDVTDCQDSLSLDRPTATGTGAAKTFKSRRKSQSASKQLRKLPKNGIVKAVIPRSNSLSTSQKRAKQLRKVPKQARDNTSSGHSETAMLSIKKSPSAAQHVMQLRDRDATISSEHSELDKAGSDSSTGTQPFGDGNNFDDIKYAAVGSRFKFDVSRKIRKRNKRSARYDAVKSMRFWAVVIVILLKLPATAVAADVVHSSGLVVCNGSKAEFRMIFTKPISKFLVADNEFGEHYVCGSDQATPGFHCLYDGNFKFIVEEASAQSSTKYTVIDDDNDTNEIRAFLYLHVVLCDMINCMRGKLGGLIFKFNVVGEPDVAAELKAFGRSVSCQKNQIEPEKSSSVVNQFSCSFPENSLTSSLAPYNITIELQDSSNITPLVVMVTDGSCRYDGPHQLPPPGNSVSSPTLLIPSTDTIHSEGNKAAITPPETTSVASSYTSDGQPEYVKYIRTGSVIVITLCAVR